MKQKIWILALLGVIVLVLGCGNGPTPTGSRTFTIEYDHQINYDVLAWGKNQVEEAFNQASTVIDFKYDDADLPNYWVRIDSLYEYYIAHVKRDSNDSVMYPGYLCSVERIRDGAGNPLDDLWGFTYYQTGPRIGHSFVVLGNPSIPYSCRSKVTIHELGHQRAGLTHLCIDNNTMNPAHNDSACVMGKDETAICTGRNLCTNPHFCEACRNIIAGISW